MKVFYLSCLIAVLFCASGCRTNPKLFKAGDIVGGVLESEYFDSRISYSSLGVEGVLYNVSYTIDGFRVNDDEVIDFRLSDHHKVSRIQGLTVIDMGFNKGSYSHSFVCVSSCGNNIKALLSDYNDLSQMITTGKLYYLETKYYSGRRHTSKYFRVLCFLVKSERAYVLFEFRTPVVAGLNVNYDEEKQWLDRLFASLIQSIKVDGIPVLVSPVDVIATPLGRCKDDVNEHDKSTPQASMNF